MARKPKAQRSAVDSASLLGDEDLAARHAYYSGMGLTLDPKARWHKAKTGWTLVIVWRGESLRMIETTRWRDIKRGRTGDAAG